MPSKKTDSKNKKAPKQSGEELIAPNTEIKLVVKWADAEPVYKKVLARLAKRLKKPGFRQGKVPAHIAEQELGEMAILDQVLQELVPAIYTEEIKKQKKNPLTQPSIKPTKLAKGNDIELIAEIAEEPEVKLGKYKDLVKKALKEAEKEVKKSSSAKASEGHRHDENCKHDHEKEEESIRLSHIFKALVQAIKPAIPELLLKDQVQREIYKLEQNLKNVNMTLDDYLKKQGLSFEAFGNQIAVERLGQLQLEFILQAIIREEKLEATDQEIDAKLEEIKKKLDPKTAKTFDKKQYLNYVTPVVNRDKVIAHLLHIK